MPRQSFYACNALVIMILNIGPLFQVFLANFLLSMRRKGYKTTSGQIFNPKFEPPWADLCVL